MNSILCVLLFCVVRKGCHKTLLRECLSLYHRIHGEVEAKDVLRESPRSNFLLSVGESRFESGKVVMRLMI